VGNQGYVIRRFLPEDRDAIVDLFNRVFGEKDPEFRAHDLSWWRWKFEQNPAGAHILVAENAAGAVVGHYGGVPIRVRADGETYVFGQNCDSYVDASERRGLKNPGTFVRLGQAYASTFASRAGDAVMYGVGTREAFRIGARYLDYWVLRTQMALVLRDPSRLPEWDWGTHAVPCERFDERADAFARSQEANYPCVGVRDAAFLNWRFTTHPTGRYRAAYAKSGDRDDYRGHAAFAVGKFGEGTRALLMDWFVDPNDEGATRSLLRWAAERAAQAGRESMTFLCPTSSPWFERFQEYGFEAEPSPYVMVARPYHPKFQPSFLRERWYYTLAEFDVV
jgi:hypothetical protein